MFPGNYEEIMEDGVLSSLHDSSESFVEYRKENLTKTKGNVPNSSSNLHETIQTDTYRSFPNATVNGLKYFISFIDDFSRHAYVFIIVDKSRARCV